jgi:hypothetical protein
MTLYYTKEDYTTLHNVMQHYTTLYKAIRYYTMLIIQDYTTLYKTIQHYTTLYNNPRADGAKRRARVLIPPRLFIPGETKALAKCKVHQWPRAWVTVSGSVGGHLTDLKNMAVCQEW